MTSEVRQHLEPSPVAGEGRLRGGAQRRLRSSLLSLSIGAAFAASIAAVADSLRPTDPAALTGGALTVARFDREAYLQPAPGLNRTQMQAFLAGVRGTTTGVADAIPVLVDSAGQLGTLSSSRRFKEEIADMGDETERLLALRPVTFRMKPEVQSGARPTEYSLIAEEVAEVFPDLVVRDEQGKPWTVKYHLLSSMLLNEFQEQARELDDVRARLVALEASVASSER